MLSLILARTRISLSLARTISADHRVYLSTTEHQHWYNSRKSCHNKAHVLLSRQHAGYLVPRRRLATYLCLLERHTISSASQCIMTTFTQLLSISMYSAFSDDNHLNNDLKACNNCLTFQTTFQTIKQPHLPNIATANMPQATATINGVEVARTNTWEIVDGNIYVRA